MAKAKKSKLKKMDNPTDNYYVIQSGNTLRIAKGFCNQNKRWLFSEKSSVKTAEIIRTVMMFFLRELQKREDKRPYVGRTDERIGTLLFIKPGWTIKVERVNEGEEEIYYDSSY